MYFRSTSERSRQARRSTDRNADQVRRITWGSSSLFRASSVPLRLRNRRPTASNSHGPSPDTDTSRDSPRHSREARGVYGFEVPSEDARERNVHGRARHDLCADVMADAGVSSFPLRRKRTRTKNASTATGLRLGPTSLRHPFTQPSSHGLSRRRRRVSRTSGGVP